jgi:transposase
MIRSSNHTIRFANTEKQEGYAFFYKEGRVVEQKFVDYLWENGYVWKDKDGEEQVFSIKENKLDLPPKLTSDIIEKANIETVLTGRALKCCMNQAAGMIKAETEKQRKRLYMLEKKKLEGQSKKKLKQLIKRIKENIPQKPDCSRVNLELNSICCNYQDIESEMFDGFIRLTSITKTKLDIRIPIKHTRHSRELQGKGELKASFLFREDSIDFRWEIPNVPKKTEGIIVGGDQGMLDVLTLSDHQVTPKTDIHGHSMESILDKICRKKYGSKGFKRATDHRENFTHWDINQLNFSKIKQVNLEQIWNINYKRKTSAKLLHWTNTVIRDKVESLCEELGVRVIHQDSTYRSQRCSACGMVRKGNRKGKIYTCKHCGLIIDADFNASKNHEVSLPEIPYTFRNLKMNRTGFFWLESGLFDLDGRNLQFLLQNKT